MASGTGTTTGPYAITAGQTLSLNDPAVWSIASEAIQIQNNTGYNVSIQTAGSAYNIQPFTASTIPCAGGQTLVAQVSSTANVSTGFLTAVWLLPGQTGPMQDGPLVVYPKSQVNITTAATVVYFPSGYNVWQVSGWPLQDTTINLYSIGTTPGGYWFLTTNPTQPTGNIYGGVLHVNPGPTTFTNIPLSNYTVLYVWYSNDPNTVTGPVTTQYISQLSATASQ